MDKKIYDSYVAILKHELVPAMGCTEPIAVAYAAAKCREVLGQFPEHIVAYLSGNIIKNVKGVTVPNSGDQRGIEVAVVLGCVGGKVLEKGHELEVIKDVTDAHIAETRRLVKTDLCEAQLVEGVDNLYICIEMIAGRPVWTEDQCNMCLACINRCPAKAIQYGKKTEKRGRYVHPIYQTNKNGEMTE